MKNIDKHVSKPITESCLVTPKGAAKAIMTGAALGAAVGSAARAANDTIANARTSGISPLERGSASLGLLALTDDEIVLVDGKRGMLGPVATKLAGSAPRGALVAGELGKGKLSSPLRLGFADGSAWELEVPRKYVKNARVLIERARA
jgi:hypothetical protein